MKNYSESFGLQYHGRSISLPSRLHHPNTIKIESLLSKLSFLKPSNTDPLTGETVQHGLIGLVELQICLEEFMESSVHYPCRIIMEDTIKRSMEILDSTSLIRDVCLKIKEHVHLLQSALRRKNGDSSIHIDIKSYFHFRKSVKKEASKILTLLKHMENRSETALTLHQNDAAIIRVLRESNAISIRLLRSVLIYLSSPSSRFKHGGRFLFRIFARLKFVDSERGGNNVYSDVGCVDFALNEHVRNNESQKDCLVFARRKLEILDSRIEALENGLEQLFRGLVRNQVSLLNIFNH